MSTVSSSTSSSTLSSLSSSTGIGGLVSGLDTDSLVESMTSATRSKIEKQEQKLQKLEWKQTAYRSVTTALKEFQSKYLDVLSSTNLRSESLYNTIAASTTSTAISVDATSNASAGSITINSITQLATSQTVTSGSTAITSALGGEMTATDITTLTDDITSDGSKSFTLTLDGTVKTITLDSDFVDAVTDDGFESALQDKINTAFGYKTGTTSKVTVSLEDDQLSFTADGSTLTVNALDSDTETVEMLGMTAGQSNKLSTSTTLENLSLATALTADTMTVTINSVDFTFSSTDTLASVMSSINSSDAGVTMSYSSITGKFSLTADDTGSGENIVVEESAGNLFTALGLTGSNSVTTEGQNAILSVDGQEITRSSNSFEVDGVTVKLLDESTDEITITMDEDTTSLKETITSFVEDYNTLIDMMNSLVKESYDSDYQPLTDDQKEEMTDDEIADWEEKAKTGLLNNDSTIKSITSKMQLLMYSSAVKGGISLYNLGITSAGYSENGKLTIDEDALEEALASNSSAVKELFTTDTTGLANQLNTIVNAAAKTSGTEGTRGTLVELAGYESTLSDTQNSLTTSIEKMNEDIATLKDYLEDEEDRYWSKFTALETALQSLNSQSAMLTSFSSS